MKNSIYVILGYSRSGKDTACNVLLNEIGGEHYKFSSPAKRVLENLYDLEWGDLDKNEVRNSVIPNHSEPNTTYLDLMVKAFKHFRALDNNIMLHSARKTIPYILESRNVFITDLRTLAELNLLLSFNVPIKVLRVYRKGTESKFYQKVLYKIFGTLFKFPANIVSDEWLEKIDFQLKMFHSDLYVWVDNDGSKESFENNLKTNFVKILKFESKNGY